MMVIGFKISKIVSRIKYKKYNLTQLHCKFYFISFEKFISEDTRKL